MSDATTDNGSLGERRRILASLAAACLFHVAVFAALALGVGIGAGVSVTPPVTIDLQVSTETDVGGSAGSAGAASGPAGGGADSGAPGTVAPAPVGPAAAAPSAPAAPAGGQGSDGGGFVVPTPRAQPVDAVPAAGPAFREAGGRTGVVQGIPSVPSPVPAPTVAPVKQGTGSGSAASSGAGSSSAQRSGTGVLVTGSSGSASGGSLDLSQLDKALAGGTSGKAAGSGGSGTSGGTGGGRTAAGTGGAGGSGGTGNGGGTGGGGGSGGAGGGGTGGSGSGQTYSVVWGGADTGKGRTLVSTFSPKVPAWVSAQGLTLSVTVSFTLLSDGVIGGVALQQSSGYPDVDTAVMDAIRRWRFTPSAGAAPAKGIIPYVIRAR